MANERMPDRIDKDFVMWVTAAALRRLMAGRARKRDDVASVLDDLPKEAMAWLAGPGRHEVFNECFLLAVDILNRKQFEYIGQAVNYLALAFTRPVYRLWFGFSTVATGQCDSDSLGNRTQEDREAEEADWVEEAGYSMVELAELLRSEFTSQQLQILAMLAAGYKRKDIIAAGVAANKTITRTKDKLRELLQQQG
jgi:hypothetical protein